MAYALVQHKRNEASSATNVTVTPDATLTSGNCLVVVVWEFAAALYTISNIQDQSNNAISFSVIGAGTSSGSNRLIMAVCENLPASVTAVKVTVAGSCTTLSTQIVEFSGIKTSSAIDVSSYQAQTSVATTTDAISSGTASPTDQPALVFAATRNASGGGAASIGTGFTTVGQGVNSLGASEHKRITSTSGVAGTFTAAASGNNHVTGVVVLLEATASGLTITSVNTTNTAFSAQTDSAVIGTGLSASVVCTYAGIACTNESASSSTSLKITFPNFFTNNIKLGRNYEFKVVG